MRTPIFVWILSFLLGWTGIASAELMVRGYQPQRHDRFFSGMDKDFIGEPFDWSGIGNTSANGTGQWATMISPIHFLTSNHFSPAVDSTLTFYTGNLMQESARRDFTITIGSLQRIGDTDLTIGTLTSRADAQGIGFYPVIGPPIPGSSDFGAMEEALLGREMFLYGQPHRVGRNTIEGFATVGDPEGPFVGPIAGATGRTLVSFFDDPGIDSEARAESGDSGAASFIVQDGSLVLAGLHWFQFEGMLGNQFVSGTGDAAVSHSIAAINVAMAGSGFSLTVVAIPEPSAIVLALIGLPALFWFRHRRHSRNRFATAA